MKSIIGTSIGIAAATVLVSLSAKAQVTIFSQNFDSGLTASESLGGYHGGDITSSTFGIVAGVGTGGSSALQEVNGTAGNTGNGYGYAAAQLQEQVVTGNTSANLSDYTLSFDALATSGSLNLQIQSWNGPNFGGGLSGTVNTAPANPGYGNDLTLNSAYTHYTLNLGNATIFPASTGFNPLGGTWQIAFQLNGGGNGNPANLTMDIDNVMLTMVSPVPEPSSIALGAMGALLGLIFICRKTVKA
jgi:PEP-CTERM motif